MLLKQRLGAQFIAGNAKKRETAKNFTKEKKKFPK